MGKKWAWMAGALVLAVQAVVVVPSASAAASTSGVDVPVGELAQGCYSIRVPDGKYLRRHDSTWFADSDRWEFDANHSDAASFSLKPTRLEHFMLMDQDGNLLSAPFWTSVSHTTEAGPTAEWKIEDSGAGIYSFRATAQSSAYLTRPSNWWRRAEVRSSQSSSRVTEFELVEQGDCTEFPEVATNAVGDAGNLKGNVADPVRGAVDAHTHIASYAMMGGSLIHGEAYSPWGVTTALDDGAGDHGSEGSFDWITNIYAGDSPFATRATDGWPTFSFWPTVDSLSYSGYYYKWMERAWLGGTRLTMSYVTGNELLCDVQTTVNPYGWFPEYSCDPMQSTREQISQIRGLVDYVDAQNGGPGKGFLVIVTTPQEARQAIADGKLAIILGIELSNVLGCGEADDCTSTDVLTALDEVYDLGVRAMMPVHKYNNGFGGVYAEGGILNAGNAIQTGNWIETEQCQNGIQARADFAENLVSPPAVPEWLAGTLDFVVGYPGYDPAIEHCNVRGLTDLGNLLVNEMIDRDMLIDLDHSDTRTGRAVLDLAEGRSYPGLVSSHSWMPAMENGQLSIEQTRLLELGGFTARYAHPVNEMQDELDEFLDVAENLSIPTSIGFGTDMSGLGGQVEPSFETGASEAEIAAAGGVSYPFTNEFGLTFERQVSGERTFDFNFDGNAHYGMLADYIEAFRQGSDERTYESIMTSAEAYLQMWERAVS